MEVVIVLPLVIFLILACLQTAHILMARQVVHYAAFCAARSQLVAGYPNYDGRRIATNAANQVCAWINLDDDPASPLPPMSFGEWGDIPGSRETDLHTRTAVSTWRVKTSGGREYPLWEVEVSVEHDFALIFPVVNQVMANPTNTLLADLFLGSTNRGGGFAPTIWPRLTLKETVMLPMPYRPYVHQSRVDYWN